MEIAVFFSCSCKCYTIKKNSLEWNLILMIYRCHSFGFLGAESALLNIDIYVAPIYSPNDALCKRMASLRWSHGFSKAHKSSFLE